MLIGTREIRHGGKRENVAAGRVRSGCAKWIDPCDLVGPYNTVGPQIEPAPHRSSHDNGVSTARSEQNHHKPSAKKLSLHVTNPAEAQAWRGFSLRHSELGARNLPSASIADRLTAKLV